MADYIEFVFVSPEDTTRAETVFPVDYLHLDGLTLAYDARCQDAIETIKARLSEAHIAFSCQDSGLSRSDVWGRG